VVAPGLFKRSGPGSDFQVVGTLAHGDLAQVYQVREGWYRIKSVAEVWCSALPQYVKRIDNPSAEG
jgi:uncharacterized protein YgiM (DUF1202 family)